MKKMIIIGAGFAGLQLAKTISKKGNINITLIDKFNFHQFQPLFYQVATGRIEPSSISFPLRKVFQKHKNVQIRLAEVQSIDSDLKVVHTDSMSYEYDLLVIATGCTTNFFGNEKIKEKSFPMKSTPEALALRNRLLLNFEDTLIADKDELEGLMNMVIVGGGPTGVELAGALAEMKKNVLPKDYPDMDFSALNIFLIEGSPHILGPMRPDSRATAQRYLEELGVQVWTDARVDDYDGKIIQLSDGRTIRTNNLIWSAGVSGNVPGGIDASMIKRGNRIEVDRFNKVVGLDGVYAVGDISYMETPLFPNGHPQVANVAINQAKNLSKNINKYGLETTKWKEFEYKDPGSMATVGKRKAVVDLPKWSFKGVFAWLTWMFLHLMLILTVKNKLIIFINWAISYFTNDTTLRLILWNSDSKKLKRIYQK